MAPHLQSVRLPDTSSETAPLRSTELTGHDDGCFGRVNKDLTNGFHMHSTNGIESKFTAGVKNDGPKRPNTDQPIAVIGMALRFPQDATSPEKFWEMLVDGRSARTEVPKGRYNVDSHYRSDASLPDALKVRTGHFLAQDIAAFDAPFFSINSTEAATIDPQQRLLLETTYEALENAGLPMDIVSGSRTSVFMGSFGTEYNALLSKDPFNEAKYKATGTALSMASNRLSWFYNLSGSSVTVDTACSSSLTALHLACEDLVHNKSEMSIVGGCNLILTPESSVDLGNIGCLSPDGISYSFDHRANGYSRGEGIGVVVIKPLDKAIKDGDMIRAVIRATGGNQDGRTVDIAQPSQSAQLALIRETYASAGLSMEPTRYVEAHGTGTSVGDPIEIGSIQSAFKASRSMEDPLFVGAVKSNIGHLEATSGMAGLIKAILTLEKGIIPGNIWFEKPNPEIDMKGSFIQFPTSAIPWPTTGLRRASVSSYGFGGANAHIILDDAYHYIHDHVSDGIHKARLVTQTAANVSLNGTVIKSPTQPLWPKVFAWSALDQSALSRMAEIYRDFLHKIPLSSDESSLLDDLAFTLSKKRSSFTWRSCIVANSLLDLVNNMASGFQNPKRSIEKPHLAFVFTGQGAQWHAMGRELISFPRYLQSLQSSQIILNRLGCTWSLLDEMFKEESASLLNNPEYSQPTCLALQIALTDLLESLHVYPTTVFGHSSGEIAAAYAMGAVSQESALRIAFSRGTVTKILQSRQGRDAEGMMAIALSEQDAMSYLNRHFKPDARIWIGCINSPKNVTITGSDCHIDYLKKILDEEGVFARKLKVDVSYHCPNMQEVALIYEKLVQNLEPRNLSYAAPTMVSTVTGQVISAKALRQSDHWVSNLVSPVQFLSAINQAFGKGSRKAPLGFGEGSRKKPLDFVLEIGPHSTLQGPLREIFQGINKEKLEYASMLVRGKSAADTMPAAMASLFCLGYPVDLNLVNSRGNSLTQGRLLTSLPSYPFDRSKKYWLEGRISKNARFSEFPHHDLLGMRDPDWNPLEAKWKSVISAAKRPWVEDHNILGSAVYPGAGMLIMAIEAARQLVSVDQHIAGFRFRDTTITKALVIPSTGDIETHFYLRPDKERTNSAIQRHEFRLCSFENGEWSENCRGSIAVELLESRPIEAPASSNRAIESDSRAGRDILNINECDISFGSKLLYTSLKNIGMDYGPSFRTLTDIFADGEGGAIGSLDLDKWKSHRPVSTIQPYVIHPAALDAMFQLPVAARLAIDAEFVPMVPTLVRDMWVSGDLLDPAPKTTYSSTADQKVLLQTKAGRTGFRSMKFSFSATKVSSQVPSVCGEVYCTSVAGGTSDTSSDFGSQLICFKIASKPELDFMKRSDIETYCRRDVPNRSFSMDASNQALLTCLLACKKVQKLVSPDQLQGDKAYLRSFLTWIDQRADLLHKMIPLTTDLNSILTGKIEQLSELLENECRQLELIGPTSRLIARSARNMLGILTGELDLLEVFFHDGLMDEYYRQDIESTSISKQSAVLVDLMVHKNPSLKILEIGAGTGAGTERILDACLCNKGTSGEYLRVAEYTFTDIAPSFLEVARSRFQAFAHSMKFATLDIEQNPCDQGFEEGYYDLIIASNVLHATKDIGATLRRAKSLLKCGGKLLLHEAVAQGPIMPGFVFGMFPGWWLSSELERKMSPLLSESQWHDYMLAAGFTGVEIALRDDKIAENDAITTRSSVMISTNPIIQEKPSICPLILIERTSHVQQLIAAHVQQKFTAAGYEMPSILFLDEFNEASYDNSDFPCCISLLELDRSILIDAEDAFMRIRALLNISRGILWVSNNMLSNESPVNSIFTGLARVLRTEHDWLKLCSLSLESDKEAQTVSQHVFDIFSATIVHGLIDEVEFVERDGLILINRATQDPLLNDHIRQRTVEQAPQMVPFKQARSRRLKLTIQMPGLLDTLQFVDHVVPDLVGPDEIEIRVEASGINFRDVLIALGQVDASYLGSECAGVVNQVGKNFNGVFAVGDRVSSMVEGSLRTFTRCHAGAACRIPDNMPFSIAASLPIIFATAYYSLHESAHIQRGESILIHSGAGGLGQACIQLAQLSGAEIYATVGTPEKRRFLETFYNIPADHLFSSRDLAFKDRILEKTRGRGVDVVINSLAGEALRASWEIIAPNGRFIEVGKKDIYNLGALPMFPFAKMATFSSVDLACLFQQSPHIIGKLFSTVLQMYGAGQIAEPTPLQVFKSSDIGQAFRLMQNGKNHGKLVIEFNEDDTIPVVPSGIPTYEFDSNATYVLSGGLGGLGRSICRWMISRGAKHFLLLSRCGPQTPQAKAFMNEAQRKGVLIFAPACDISNKEALMRTLNDASKHMPPFKGCIQGAMQLCDKRFSEMTLEEFKVPLSSKVDGSWNLHTLMPSGLDFFILLASVSGACGTHGQSNYAAANTYQDSLAQHRIAHGERTWVLDLGNFQSIGHWELLSDDLAKAVGAHNYRSIYERELHATLEYYCNPRMPMPSLEESRVIIGLELPFTLNAKGIEDPYWMASPLFKHLYRMDGGRNSGTEIALSVVNLEVALAKASSLADASDVVIDGLQEKLTKTLGIEQSDIDPSKSMLVYGVDSLAAVEIRTWFKNVVGADVTVFEILSNASVEAMAVTAAKRSRHVRVESFGNEEE